MQQNITLLVVPPFSSLCALAFNLRREVFVMEQNVPEEEELDSYDLTASHIVAIKNGDVVGTLRLIETPEHVKIGRVAVRVAARGKGIAKEMMLFAMDHAKAQGQDKFMLGAQLDKLAFYEKLGFTAYGEVFDDGGMPHKAMRTYTPVV